MKCIINNKTYSDLEDLKFTPQTDFTGDHIPINQFEVRLLTNDVIDYGQYVELRDDLNNIWANYWISYAERIGQDVDSGTYIVRLIAQSSLAFLERVKLPAKMYNTKAPNVLSDILTSAGQPDAITLEYELYLDWLDIDINGFCPEQTARERLQWLLVCTKGYIQSYFDNSIKIRRVPLISEALIPIEKTFWKPSVSHRDYVTQIKVTAYTYTEGLPHTYDDYVTDGERYWVQSKQVITMNNRNIPEGIPENIIDISDITMISPDIADMITRNLVAYYFNRMEVDCDVIDNGEYIPGNMVTVYTDECSLCRGYIDTIDFRFGLQARGTIHLTAAADVAGAYLSIHYMWNNIKIAGVGYYLPKNYEYSITTRYIDWKMNQHQYVFRPTIDSVSGTLTQNSLVTVPCEIALDHYRIETVDFGIQKIQEEYDTMYALLYQYYRPKIFVDAKASENYKKIRSILNGIYYDKKGLVEQYTDILHILSVDELILDESAEERVVDIS